MDQKNPFVFVTLGWGDESDRRRVHGGWAQLQRSWSALISGILVVSFHHVFFAEDSLERINSIFIIKNY